MQEDPLETTAFDNVAIPWMRMWVDEGTDAGIVAVIVDGKLSARHDKSREIGSTGEYNEAIANILANSTERTGTLAPTFNE
jgi:hypothetical protein